VITAAQRYRRGSYVPERGDLIWLDFDPHSGREQAGRRPAIVLSPASYNEKTRLMVACPITSHAKRYPFEVSLPDKLPISGVILADHVKSLDWVGRQAEFIDQVPDDVLADVMERLMTLLAP
jgi:mRNA interferase MazF